MRVFNIVLMLLLSANAFGLDRTTPVSFSSKGSSTYRFDTRYSLPYSESEGFLLGVANQRSLGTFTQTSVTQTDEFEDATKKRLNEYSSLSAELATDLKKTLPTLSSPKLKMVRLSNPIASGTPPSTKSPWEYSKESIERQLTIINQNLAGANRSLGLSGYNSIKAIVDSNPKSVVFDSARNRLTTIEQTYFSKGVLRSHQLSDLSSVLSSDTTQGKFLINIVNQCIVGSSCDGVSMRVLVANLDMFGSAKDLPGIGTRLSQAGYSLGSVEEALSIVSTLSPLTKISACSEIDCGDYRAFYIQNLIKKYQIPENIANLAADAVIKSKE